MEPIFFTQLVLYPLRLHHKRILSHRHTVLDTYITVPITINQWKLQEINYWEWCAIGCDVAWHDCIYEAGVWMVALGAICFLYFVWYLAKNALYLYKWLDQFLVTSYTMLNHVLLAINDYLIRGSNLTSFPLPERPPIRQTREACSATISTSKACLGYQYSRSSKLTYICKI